MTIETNTYAAQATASQVYFDDASMSDVEIEQFLTEVDEANEALFATDRTNLDVAGEGAASNASLEAWETSADDANGDVVDTERISTDSTAGFPSALCAVDYFNAMRDTAIESQYTMPPYNLCGYALIDGQLVPETFIKRVKKELEDSQFEYGYILGVDDVFSEEFLESLDDDERGLLMHVVLLLVSRGEFPLNLWAAKGLGYSD